MTENEWTEEIERLKLEAAKSNDLARELHRMLAHADDELAEARSTLRLALGFAERELEQRRQGGERKYIVEAAFTVQHIRRALREK